MIKYYISDTYKSFDISGVRFLQPNDDVII